MLRHGGAIVDVMAVALILMAGIRAYRSPIVYIVERAFNRTIWVVTLIISCWPAKIASAFLAYQLIGPYVGPWFTVTGIFRSGADFPVSGYRVTGADIQGLHEAVVWATRGWLPPDLDALLIPLFLKYVLSPGSAQAWMDASPTYHALLTSLVVAAIYLTFFAILAFRDFPMFLSRLLRRHTQPFSEGLAWRAARVSSERGLDVHIKVTNACAGAIHAWFVFWTMRFVVIGLGRLLMAAEGVHSEGLIKMIAMLDDSKIGVLGSRAVLTALKVFGIEY